MLKIKNFRDIFEKLFGVLFTTLSKILNIEKVWVFRYTTVAKPDRV